MNYRILAALAAVVTLGLAGCQSCDKAPVPGDGLEPDLAFNKRVDGLCITLPVLNCDICLGVDCAPDLPTLLSPGSFYEPAERPALAAAPCYAPAPAVAGPCAPGTEIVPGAGWVDVTHRVSAAPEAAPGFPPPTIASGECAECARWSGSASDGITIVGVRIDNDYGTPPTTWGDNMGGAK